MGSARPSEALLALLVGAALLGGCVPTCESVCRKAMACGLTARLNELECEESCTRQADLYDDWEDDAKIDAFADHKSCIMDSTCEEIEAGACYDESIFVF